MENDDIKKIIEETVNATVIKLKMSGLIKDSRKTAYQKTEELLRNYETFKKAQDQPQTEKVINTMDSALHDLESDLYYEIIPMIYFQGMTREEVAEFFDTTVTTISRNKNRLVNKLKARIFSDDMIYELFL